MGTLVPLLIKDQNFGRQFSCWREGVTSKGKHYKGRRCCTKVNKKYRIMQADMHNLFPAIGELNADRKNFKFDFELSSQGQYGECREALHLATASINTWPAEASTLGHREHLISSHYFS